MKVGIVGDPHEPFCHPMYRRFCQDIFEAWGVQRIHIIGDIVDSHALSFHDTDPNGHSAKDELDLARHYVGQWYALFPKATVSIGNHDARYFRKARKAGIPDDYLRPFSDVMQTPKWDWQFDHRFDNFLVRHGTGSSGKDAAINQAIQRRTNLCQGHVHTYGGVKWHANDESTIFGMNVGCGIDCRTYAAAYAKDFAVRPTLGCGVVIDGHPYFEIMPCGPKDAYHRSRAGRRRR